MKGLGRELAGCRCTCGFQKLMGACGAAAGLLFFELMFLTFRSMFTALFTFPEVRQYLCASHVSL